MNDIRFPTSRSCHSNPFLGPTLMTGGSLGVEASLISLVIVLIAGCLLLMKAYQKGQLVSGKSQRATVNMQMAGHGPDSS